MNEDVVGLSLLVILGVVHLMLIISLQCLLVVRLARQHPTLPKSELFLMSMVPFRKVPQILPENLMERRLRLAVTTLSFCGVGVFVLAKVLLD